jgi:uncharacterized protein YbjT (DUF2867 family)
MTSRPGHVVPGFRTVLGDFSQPDSLVAAFRGFDTVFLLQPLVPDMVAFGLNAVAAAQAAGVKRIVRSSGGGADSASPFSLPKAHGVIDDAVRASGLSWTLLRPTSFMQNHITFNAGAIRSGTLYAPHGDGATALVDVRDIAAVAALVLAGPAAHHDQAYDLTGAQALTDAEQMAIIGTTISRPVAYVDVPESAAAEAMTGMGCPAILVDWLMSLNAIVKAGYAAGQSPDVLRVTGQAPRTFAAFAQDHRDIWA